MNTRIIPRLDIKGPNLVKGIHFEGLRVLGRPEAFARHYYEQGADELIYMDAVASLYERNSLAEMIQRTSAELFIPLTVGGGLRSLDDIRAALRSGADKVSLNTAAIRRPELIREASRAFGSSTIVISIEAIKRPSGEYEAYTDFGRQRTGLEVRSWARQAVDLGAGEILVTSIEREGTGRGFDLDLIRSIAREVPVPVIAAGGAGGAPDVVQAVREGLADAVAVASILHYEYVRTHPPNLEPHEEGNIDFLQRTGLFSKTQPTSLSEIREELHRAGIAARRVRTSDGTHHG